MATAALEIVRVDVYPAAVGEQGWRVHAVRSDGTRDLCWSAEDRLADAIEEAIDRYDLPACRDDFGVDTREGWAIWERVDDGDKPALTTKDGLTVYDLDPQSSELWAVAGPAGFKKGDIDTDNLPEGFRWVTAEEWQELVSDGD